MTPDKNRRRNLVTATRSAGVGSARLVTVGSGVEVRAVEERGELEAMCALFDRVWRTEVTPVPLPLLRALADHGGMVLGAFRQGRLVGGAVGILGVHGGRASVHSHIVGVADEWQGHGVGKLLKHRQRSWCGERGIDQLTWTFDPLIRHNAGFNIGALGAVGVTYRQDYYGSMDDAYNAGAPTDRVLAHWDLGREPDPARAEHRPGGVLLDVDEHGEPAASAAGYPAEALIRVPRTPPADAGSRSRWRLALRAAMAPLFERGYRWTGVSGEGWYVLTAAPRAKGSP